MHLSFIAQSINAARGIDNSIC